MGIDGIHISGLLGLLVNSAEDSEGGAKERAPDDQAVGHAARLARRDLDAQQRQDRLHGSISEDMEFEVTTDDTIG